MLDLRRLSIHQVTLLRQCTTPQFVAALTRNGVPCTSLWRDKTLEYGVEKTARIVATEEVTAFKGQLAEWDQLLSFSFLALLDYHARRMDSVRPQKPLPVEVDHVRWRIGNPNFGFPGNVAEKSYHGGPVHEGRHENPTRWTHLEHCLGFSMPL